MDLLKSLKEKAEYFSDAEEDQGISSVVSHIEIAERHYDGGKSGDDYLFNDVIYRTNQAFEGALKETYRIVTGKDSEKLTPHKIEKYFEQNNVLKERVLSLFTNYRTEWRNKSTHDYKLYFSEQEAFLAIVSISAFINILLDQMIEKRAYDKEASEIESGRLPGISLPPNVGLLEQVIHLLKAFSNVIPHKVSGSTIPRITEREIIGSLTAYVNELASDINVYSEYSIQLGDSRKRFIADFLFEYAGEKLLVEIKRALTHPLRSLRDGQEQLVRYMAASGIEQGILYIPPLNVGVEMEVCTIKRKFGDKEYTIVLLYPKSGLNK